MNEDERQFYLRKYAINIAKAASTTNENETESDDKMATAAKSDDVLISGDAANEQRTSAEIDKTIESADEFIPALMIIKQMPYTRAEQRRRLVGFWQVSALNYSTLTFVISIVQTSSRMLICLFLDFHTDCFGPAEAQATTRLIAPSVRSQVEQQVLDHL